MPQLPESFHAVVIGGGLGGLAAALRLRASGARVTLLEKNAQTGGKAVEIRAAGFRWDTGPSLLTMPWVLEDLFTAAGARSSDHLSLERISPVCRYFWPDGTSIDEDEAFFQRPEVARFLHYAQGIYELSGEAFLTRPPEDLWKAFHPANWHKLIHLPKVATFQSVSQTVDRYFTDSHLRQLFKRFATYNGSSPYAAPATFNVIPYVEATFGAWYVRGGMARIAEALTRLACERGITVRTATEVLRIDASGIHLRGGEILQADCTVFNGDVIRAHRDCIRFPGHEAEAARLAKPALSLSGFVLLLGVDRRFPQLSHHNIYFSQDYRTEFNDLFQRRIPPGEPTLYLSATAHSDPADAPPGGDNLFILANCPADDGTVDWSTGKESYAEEIIQMLERRGLSGLRGSIRHQEALSPADFAARDLSSGGALYGWASHSPLTALLRPPLQSRLDPSVFFVGGTTHPGGGIPLVLLSAQMAVEKILRRFGDGGSRP
ncbi:MAG: phytoene desaturase family protein [Candidatus Methylacidiphilales bacterium]|nr:phytoene desaturase family protein [Candidatus Methylacidiphilales bacterium]